MAMSFIAMFIEPEGLIDSSILWLIAQVLVFCGSIFGLSNYVKDGKNVVQRLDDLENKLLGNKKEAE